MSYSKQKKIKMIFIYGEARQCLGEAVRIYQQRFPKRICSSRFTYVNIIKIFRETSSLVNV